MPLKTEKPKLTKAEAGRLGGLKGGLKGGKIGGKRSRGGGRPRGSGKYKTDEERIAAKRASALASYHRRKHLAASTAGLNRETPEFRL